MTIARDLEPELRAAAREYPVVTLLGPRQSGKTTLARRVFPRKPYLSLEDPDQRARAEIDPRGFLADLPKGAVLDEIQRAPQLLSYLQAMVDERRVGGQWILTGSHQPEVHQAVSQTLAGRTAVLLLLPFSLDELRRYRRALDPWQLAVTGSFPRVHDEGLDARRFFRGYVQTYVERDVRALVQLKDLRRFQRFLVLVAGRVGQLLNASSLANDVGVSATTIRDWIDVLVATYLVFELPPYFENVGKRVIRSPKLFFSDTGLVSYLLGIHTAEQAARDPLRGALYENLCVSEVLKARANRGLAPEIYFFRDSRGNEVDLIVRDGRRLVPIEIKSASTFTEAFHRGIAGFREVLGERVDAGAVLYSGGERFRFRGTAVFNPLQHRGLAGLVSPN